MAQNMVSQPASQRANQPANKPANQPANKRARQPTDIQRQNQTPKSKKPFKHEARDTAPSINLH